MWVPSTKMSVDYLAQGLEIGIDGAYHVHNFQRLLARKPLGSTCFVINSDSNPEPLITRSELTLL
jgi:hypothetical protein